MAQKYTWKSNRFFKVFGVIALMILCVIACLSGYLVLYQVESRGADSWFDTSTAIYRIQEDTRNFLDDYIKEDSSLNEEINSDEDYQIDELLNGKYKTIYNTIDPKKKYAYSMSYMFFQYTDDSDTDIHYAGFGSANELQHEEVTTADGDRVFIVTVSIMKPSNSTDPYYVEYVKYENLKQYMPYAMPIFIGTLWIALGILILEFISVGYVNGEEGIHLSWFDKIPFDIVLLGSCISIPVLFECLISLIDVFPSIVSDYSYVIFPISCIELICLNIYFLIITLIVRIKSHTLLENNLCSKVFIYIKDKVQLFYKNVLAIPKWWLALVLCGYGMGILIQMTMLDYTGPLGVFFLGIEIFAGIIMVLCGRDGWLLLKTSKELSNGNLEYQIKETELNRMKGPFYEMGKNFTNIGEAMETAVSEKMKSERMKTELITNVSHDLKTPLTSIINYVDLLKKQHTPEMEKEYLEILDKQSQRLKRLTEDVVEASKASSGSITVNMTDIDVQEILEQAQAEYEDKLKSAELKVIVHNEVEHAKVKADGRLLWRVFRNLLSNICKYSLPGTRVYINVMEKADTILIEFKNTSREELNISADELKERFVRGDSSRHVEGSGLGLSIVESLMNLMQGSCEVVIDGDLFKIIITLTIEQS